MRQELHKINTVSKLIFLEIKSRKTWQIVKKYCQNLAPSIATHIVDPIVAPPGFGRLVPSPVAPVDALYPPISSIFPPPQHSPPWAPRTRHLSTHQQLPFPTRAARAHHIPTHQQPPATAYASTISQLRLVSTVIMPVLNVTSSGLFIGKPPR